MSRQTKVFEKIRVGDSDTNIRFDEMRALLARPDFRERIRGSHHIFTRAGMETLIDLQPRQGKCKRYQVRQVREVLTKFSISL